MSEGIVALTPLGEVPPNPVRVPYSITSLYPNLQTYYNHLLREEWEYRKAESDSTLDNNSRREFVKDFEQLLADLKELSDYFSLKTLVEKVNPRRAAVPTMDFFTRIEDSLQPVEDDTNLA